MAIEKLSVFDNVAMIHEHSGAKRATRRADVLGRDRFRRARAPPKTKVGELGARERRLVEVARAVVGSPRVVLLDEPAAGLPDEETEQLGEVIQRIPSEFGALVILVDHDMSLVSACCETTAVLDFGKLIASGPDGRGAAQRARDPRLSRHGGGAVSAAREGADASSSTALTRRARRPAGGPRRLARDPARPGDDPARRRTARANRRWCSRLRACCARAPGASCSATATSRSCRPEQVRAAGVAVVPEGRRLLPGLTVEDNLRVATYSLSREQAKTASRTRSSSSRSSRSAGRASARSLSGGEQQMVVLAQALVSRPKILLVDELSLGLAPVVVKRLVPTLEAVAANGVGVLLIEQFAHVALGLAETAYVLEGGRIRYHGTAQRLKDEPELLHSAYLLRDADTSGTAGAELA